MSDQSEFEKTPVNQVRQAAKRGHYDRDTVHQVLDSNLVLRQVLELGFHRLATTRELEI